MSMRSLRAFCLTSSSGVALHCDRGEYSFALVQGDGNPHFIFVYIFAQARYRMTRPVMSDLTNILRHRDKVSADMDMKPDTAL